MSYMVFRHRVDLWTPTRSTNAAGQRKATWAVDETSVKCHYIPRSSVERLRPTAEDNENIVIFFPASVELASDTRLYNLTDKFGNVVEEGPLQINGIEKQPGYTGKVRHYLVKVKRVIET